MTLRLGTRRSALALVQANMARQALLDIHPDMQVELVLITSEGDVREEPLSALGGQGIFTAAISKALDDGEIDAAVHSLKDLPTTLSDGHLLGAVLEREDPRDVLISTHSFENLEMDALIGTGSLRRKAQLRALRPDLAFADIRGNVETRLRKVTAGEFRGTLLAQAGLNRLEKLGETKPSGIISGKTSVFPFEVTAVTPAVGQGAIGLECLKDDKRTRTFLEAVNHAPSLRAVTCERRLLARLKGGCQVPFAAHVSAEGQLHLCIANPETPECYRRSGPFEDADSLMDSLLVEAKSIIETYLD